MPLQRLQAFLGLLFQRRADLEAEVKFLPTAQQLQRLHDGDLARPAPRHGGRPRVEAERLYRGEALAAVVSLSHRVAGRESAQLEDLVGDVLVVVPRHAEPGLHDRVVALARSNGVAFREIRGLRARRP